MKILALINQKGGVGKTTTAANLGSGLARLGRKVLLVDIDPQANLSLHLDIDVFKTNRTIYDLLVGKSPVEDMIVPTSEEGLKIIPSHIDLCSAELELVNTVGREVILRDALRQYAERTPDPPDYILIDCPPSLGLLSLNALSVAQEVIIPIQAEFFALQGMGKLVEVVNLVKSRLNAELKIGGIVICMYRSQTTLAKEVLREVKSYFGDVVFETKVRQNIRLAEAPGHGKTIFDYDPNSNGAADYMELAREVAGEAASRSDDEPSVQKINQEKTMDLSPESPEESPVQAGDDQALEDDGEETQLEEIKAPELKSPSRDQLSGDMQSHTYEG